MSGADAVAHVDVRPPRAHEHAALGAVITDAFLEMAAAGQAGGEAALVDALRTDGDLLCELVAVTAAGELVGHIAFSRLGAPAPVRAAALAPVSVVPAWQGRGVGGALIRAGLERLHADGVHLVLVLGHPHYYPRFGFSAERAASLVTTPWDGPHMMALELTPCAWPARPFAVTYARAFEG